MMRSYTTDLLGNTDLPPKLILPAVTVRQAIADLAPIKSGETATCYSSKPHNKYQLDRKRRTRQ